MQKAGYEYLLFVVGGFCAEGGVLRFVPLAKEGRVVVVVPGEGIPLMLPRMMGPCPRLKRGRKK